MIEARPRRPSSMPPHNRMPHGIPHHGERNRHQVVIHRNGRKPSNNPLSPAIHKPESFDEYISHLEVVPGKPGDPIFVIAELRGVVPCKDFILQPVKTSEDPLIFAAEARIGLNQKGFVAVKTDNHSLSMRVGDATGPLQEQKVKMPPYNPRRLVIECSNNLIIATVT